MVFPPIPNTPAETGRTGGRKAKTIDQRVSEMQKSGQDALNRAEAKRAGREQRAKLPKRITLTDAERQALPLLAVQNRMNSGWPPSVSRSPAALSGRIRRLEAMRQVGPVVFVTLDHPDLTPRPLKAKRTVNAWKKELRGTLTALCNGKLPETYDSVLQRGQAHEGVHSHTALFLSDLAAPIQAEVLTFPSGKGKGGKLAPGLHMVVVTDTPDDFEAVARYMSGPSDSRLKYPERRIPYLLALECELAEKRARRGRNCPPLADWRVVETGASSSITPLHTPQTPVTHRPTQPLDEVNFRQVESQGASGVLPDPSSDGFFDPGGLNDDQPQPKRNKRARASRPSAGVETARRGDHSAGINTTRHGCQADGSARRPAQGRKAGRDSAPDHRGQARSRSCRVCNTARPAQRLSASGGEVHGDGV